MMIERKDADLVSRGKTGDPEALNDLVRLYWHGAYKYALHILRCPEDAEDVAQECLLAAIMHLGTFDERASFGTWLTRIVFNRSIMLLRRKRSCALDAACAFDEQMHGSLMQMQASPESEVIRAECDRLLNDAVKTLPEDYSAPLWLYTCKEQSVNDIAQHLRMSPGTVKIRLHRARKLVCKKAARMLSHRSLRIARAA